MDVSKDLIAASATPLILAILRQQDSYGYEIIKHIKEVSNDELIWTEGMLYPVLHRLEKNGLVESYWKKSQAGRRRKYYRLQEAGQLELERHMEQWELLFSILSTTIKGDGERRAIFDV
ncbi:MAG TPA: helix-turn-helix transcriptional regulator [Firmicutes bacterium]|nr:helix-turn-helix transcriptional regulator [Bacillota bacterium]